MGYVKSCDTSADKNFLVIRKEDLAKYKYTVVLIS